LAASLSLAGLLRALARAAQTVGDPRGSLPQLVGRVAGQPSAVGGAADAVGELVGAVGEGAEPGSSFVQLGVCSLESVGDAGQLVGDLRGLERCAVGLGDGAHPLYAVDLGQAGADGVQTGQITAVAHVAVGLDEQVVRQDLVGGEVSAEGRETLVARCGGRLS
jgi:ABC-type transporter Mla subunit MlaD